MTPASQARPHLPLRHAPQQVFDTARATVSEEQALDLQLALSTALVEGEEGRNRLNNRATQLRNGRRVYVSA